MAQGRKKVVFPLINATMNHKAVLLCFAHFLLFAFRAFTQESDSTFLYEFNLKDLQQEHGEIITIGTRTTGRTITESPVPVDIIYAHEIATSSQIELSQIITYLLPSFNANYQTIADGTDHIVPASFRGLGPDQILVYINGKRRHTSSLLNVNGTFGRGAVSTDFDAIPVASIERIEILRDGASAQYGSDAIAGVINIVTKNKLGLEMSADIGVMQAGDGQRVKYDVNYGAKIGARGFINFTGEVVKRNRTDRSGEYTGTIYHDDANEDNADERSRDFERDIMKIGVADAKTGKLFYNLLLPLRGLAELYSFGGITYRQGNASGFYRFPKESVKVVPEIYPDGFLPSMNVPITDQSICFGIRQKYAKWNIDFSNTYGRNAFEFNVENSNNASLGPSSPVDFYCGAYTFSQNTTNFDITRKFQSIPLVKNINVAFGGDFRLDNYSISSGEEASWIIGESKTPDGTQRTGGAQFFPGFLPQNELSESRFSTSFYIDIESEITNKLLIEFASNYVSYTDWGNNFSGKVVTRYKLAPSILFRGGMSTGFRAPSLHQSYSTNVSTQIIDGESNQVGTFNKKSSVTKAFGFPDLKEENSVGYNVGAIITPLPNFMITLDAFQMNIYNRIVLSGLFKEEHGPDIAELIEPYNINAAQFYTNAINTTTYGGDVYASYKHEINSSHSFALSLRYNQSKTSIIGKITTSEQLQGKEDILFNREERSRIEDAQPLNKIIVSAKYKIHKYNIMAQSIRFGQVKYIHPENPGQDQTFQPKWVTDIQLGYNFAEKIQLSVGGSNIFDIYPDKLNNELNTSSGQFIYSRRVTQFGFTGAYWYCKLRVEL